MVCSTTNLNQPPAIKLETTDVGQNILPQLIGQNLPFLTHRDPCFNKSQSLLGRSEVRDARIPWTTTHPDAAGHHDDCQSRMDLCFSMKGRNGL